VHSESAGLERQYSKPNITLCTQNYTLHTAHYSTLHTTNRPEEVDCTVQVRPQAPPATQARTAQHATLTAGSESLALLTVGAPPPSLSALSERERERERERDRRTDRLTERLTDWKTAA
jgi:hypothetical protein